MKGSTMLSTMQWLGIVPSFSRPNVSDDNPFVESIFRTLKYRPGTPSRFASLADAVAWVEKLVRWYNFEHLHSGIGFVTPEDRAVSRKLSPKSFGQLENRASELTGLSATEPMGVQFRV
jgi:putative transposase